MSEATDRARRRGRPTQFEREEVLERLVDLFWTRGYEAASLSDIVAASGLSKSSLYNSFGSKEDLFREVLGRYVELEVEEFSTWVASGDSLPHLHRVVDEERRRLDSDDGPTGCLAMNTSLELAGQDASLAKLSGRHRTLRRDALRQVFAKAAERGHVNPDRVNEHTESLLALLLLASMASRGGAEADEREGIYRAAHAVISAAEADRTTRARTEATARAPERRPAQAPTMPALPPVPRPLY